MAHDSFLVGFVDKYHLWSSLALLVLLGGYHLLYQMVHLCYELLGELSDRYYAHKIKCLENKRRYDRAVRRFLTPTQSPPAAPPAPRPAANSPA